MWEILLDVQFWILAATIAAVIVGFAVLMARAQAALYRKVLFDPMHRGAQRTRVWARSEEVEEVLTSLSSLAALFEGEGCREAANFLKRTHNLVCDVRGFGLDQVIEREKRRSKEVV
jgi:hypothetical protein